MNDLTIIPLKFKRTMKFSNVSIDIDSNGSAEMVLGGVGQD